LPAALNAADQWRAGEHGDLEVTASPVFYAGRILYRFNGARFAISIASAHSNPVLRFGGAMRGRGLRLSSSRRVSA